MIKNTFTINKLIFICIPALISMTSNIANCATVGSDNPITNFEELLLSFNIEQLEEVNRLLDGNDNQQGASRFGWESLGVFLVGTLAIIIVARYGSVILDSLHEIAEGLWHGLDQVAIDAARQATINRVAALARDPDNHLRIIRALEIVQNNPHA